MPQHLDPALSAEIRATVGHLPKWDGDPTGNAINYNGAPVAYAVNVTLLHGRMERHSAGVRLPTPRTRALLVERASGDGEEGTESGFSGYIDVMSDPEKKLTDAAFDPVAHAAGAEGEQEVGLSRRKMRTIDFSLGEVVKSGINLGLGQRFAETRHNGEGEIHVAPVLGVCTTWLRPRLRIKRDEISRATWVPLNKVAQRNLSPGYLENTLPNALGSLGLRREAIDDLLRPR
jgi:hypothetical protein